MYACMPTCGCFGNFEIIPNRKKTKCGQKKQKTKKKKTLENQRIVYNLGNENKIQKYRVIYATAPQTHSKIVNVCICVWE